MKQINKIDITLFDNGFDAILPYTCKNGGMVVEQLSYRDGIANYQTICKCDLRTDTAVSNDASTLETLAETIRETAISLRIVDLLNKYDSDKQVIDQLVYR